MFAKPISELTYADVESLVKHQKKAEGINLDYKKDIGKPDKAKNDLAKDVSAFANTEGGYLIFGVSDSLEIVGIDTEIIGKPVVEWINQVLDSNITLKVKYHDPKVIQIPNSEKILVVIHVPESGRKPHMVNEEHRYYVRINDAAKPANHTQVRDMFEFSKNRSAELNSFLEKRKLLNEDSDEFGKNTNSLRLCNHEFKTEAPKIPLILFSLVPKNISSEDVGIPYEEVSEWLKNNSKGYFPSTEQNLYYYHNNVQPKLDGLSIKHTNNNYVKSYFEVLNNGFVEAGFSESIFGKFQRSEREVKFAHLTSIAVYEMLLLGFAKKFYEFIGYQDEVHLQVSFANTLGLSLEGFFTDRNRYSFYGTPVNSSNNNFKLFHTFFPENLTTETIRNIARDHTEKISRAFGFEKSYCFQGDNVNLSEFNGFFHL